MMRTVVALVFAAATLAACTAHKDVVSSYVGMPEGELITRWGVPDQTYRGDDGTRYLTYRRTKTYRPMDDVKLTGRCVTTFKVVDGKVTSANWQGNDC